MRDCARERTLPGASSGFGAHQIRVMPYETAPCRRPWRWSFGGPGATLEVVSAPGNHRAVKDLRRLWPPERRGVAQPLRLAGRVSRQARRTYQPTCGAAASNAPQNRGAFSSGEDLMSMLLNFVKSVGRKDEGQDLLEYALLVALIALIAIGAVAAAGTSVQAIFTNIAGQLAAAA
jgi:pilus assembly protein Flp/PilA